MGRMCYLCRRKASKPENISLFQFPKEPLARDKWIKACDLLPTDDLRHVFICSMHFSAEHMYRGSNRFNLKCFAIPSIGVPNKPVVQNTKIDAPIILLLRKNETINSSIAFDNSHSTENVQESAVPIEYDAHFTQDVQELTSPLECNVHTTKDVQESAVPIEYDAHFTQDVQELTSPLECNVHTTKDVQELASPIESDGEVPLEQCNEHDYYTAPKKRRCFEPRYVSEIRTSDFRTPKQAKRMVNLILETDKRKSKLINKLKARNRTLEKRVASMLQIIDLHKRKGVTKDTGSHFLDIMADCGNTSSVKRNGEYHPEIRNFAMALHFYSARAYDYVRTKFNNLLPHPATVRGWNAVVNGSPKVTVEALEDFNLNNVKTE